MALTPIQRDICSLISANRIEQGESYVAGGAALNTVIHAPRISRDLDLFHDTEEALNVTWEADRKLLEGNGFQVRVLRERPSFIEAEVVKGGSLALAEWARDSAFRFFPLVKHTELGLTLHPFDLATNKVLALVGRLEPRDWVDLINCHFRIQPLGFLAWAACGKDPGFSPAGILEHAGRTTHYSESELSELAFDGPPPDAPHLSIHWKTMMEEASAIISSLPAG